MKIYPLEIVELREFEGGHLGWWSKGHHDRAAFTAAVLTEELDIPTEADDMPGLMEYCRHEWWRCVPVGPGEHGTLLVSAKAGARGAFPVTVVED